MPKPVYKHNKLPIVSILAFSLLLLLLCYRGNTGQRPAEPSSANSAPSKPISKHTLMPAHVAMRDSSHVAAADMECTPPDGYMPITPKNIHPAVNGLDTAAADKLLDYTVEVNTTSMPSYVCIDCQKTGTAGEAEIDVSEGKTDGMGNPVYAQLPYALKIEAGLTSQKITFHVKKNTADKTIIIYAYKHGVPQNKRYTSLIVQNDTFRALLNRRILSDGQPTPISYNPPPLANIQSGVEDFACRVDVNRLFSPTDIQTYNTLAAQTNAPTLIGTARDHNFIWVTCDQPNAYKPVRTRNQRRTDWPAKLYYDDNMRYENIKVRSTGRTKDDANNDITSVTLSFYKAKRDVSQEPKSSDLPNQSFYIDVVK